jgi:hypothetical protein
MSELDAESIATLIKGGATALSVALGSKPAAVFIEKVSGLVGWAIEPTTIKRKARAEAAASIIKAEADQEIKSLEQRVAARIIHEETKFQENIEAIVLKALSNISDTAKPDEVDDDWFSALFNKCRLVSNEQVQNLWAQILAGEVNQPGTFSPITLNALSLLTSEDVFLFKRLSSYVWTDDENIPILVLPYDLIVDKEIVSLTGGNLLHFGYVGLATYEVIPFSVSGENMELSYQGKHYSVKKNNLTENTKITGFPTGQMNLTQAGRELFIICNPEPNWIYVDRAIELWRSNNFELTEFSK